MFPINSILPSSTSDQKIAIIIPNELKIKTFRFLPIKSLTLSRLVSSIWKTFIDTHFTEVFSNQFIFILQKYPILDQNKKNCLLQFAVKKIVAAEDFQQALEMEKKLEGMFIVKETLEDLTTHADSKEKILNLFDLFLNRKKELRHDFFSSISPLIKRYFSIHTSLKKEKQEAIADNFKEALSILKKFDIDQQVHLLVSLYLVETYPEQARNQQEALIDCLKLKNDWFHYLETQEVVKEFSFSTFFNFLLIAKFPLERYSIQSCIFDRITNREDALAFLRMGGKDVHHFIQYPAIYKHLNFFDLLRGAVNLPSGEPATYQFYRTILKQAESAGEFEIGLQKLLERKPQEENSKHYLRLIVSIILNETPTNYLSFGIYEMLLYYPDSISFANAFLRIASRCEKILCKTILSTVKRMPELNDEIYTKIIALEIERGEFEQAKQTFYLIKDPLLKLEAADQFSFFFIEKEEWDHFDAFFKEQHALFNQELVNGAPIFIEQIEQVAKKDAKRALNLVRTYYTGYQLATFLIIIAAAQKNLKIDFLPVVFEARSLITSLITSNEDASQALHLLKKLLELQWDN